MSLAGKSLEPTNLARIEKIISKFPNEDTIGVIDFTQPNTNYRFYIINNKNGQLIDNFRVAHGSGSGKGSMVERVSNKYGSLCTSVGVYRVGETYYGKYGKSLRLDGLEKGFNSNARMRAVVLHRSNYVTKTKVGHSWGCFAVDNSQFEEIFHLLENKKIIIAYWPEPDWLKNSFYLK